MDHHPWLAKMVGFHLLTILQIACGYKNFDKDLLFRLSNVLLREPDHIRLLSVALLNSSFYILLRRITQFFIFKGENLSYSSANLQLT